MRSAVQSSRLTNLTRTELALRLGLEHIKHEMSRSYFNDDNHSRSLLFHIPQHPSRAASSPKEAI
jgi:hypothetical protein